MNLNKMKAKKLWGGRFKEKIDKDFDQFQKSIHYDYKLARYDVYHSLVHTGALYREGILNKEEYKKLSSELNRLLKTIEEGEFKPDLSCEDIHTCIQNIIEEKAGKVALKLHTLRSRNDQVVFDEKWYCYTEGVSLIKLLFNLLSSLIFLGDKYSKYFVVGYTHTQRAQVVSFKDYLGAFHCMFKKDYDRVNYFKKNLIIYIGSGALTGSSLRKESYTEAIKECLKHGAEISLMKLPLSALDNVSDRDFVIEFLSILSILQMHLSRMAEDFILYSTKEFDFLDLPEQFCTGSSLMPHKKNPDLLELVRGYTGRVYGNLISVLTTMKGLPLTYNRDMQLDKEPLFSSVEIVKQELKLMGKFIKAIKLKKANIDKALDDESLYATEIAEFLVGNNVTFAQAHAVVGKLIRYSEDKEIKIREMPDGLLKVYHKKLSSKAIKKIMNPNYAVSSKKSISRKALKTR